MEDTTNYLKVMNLLYFNIYNNCINYGNIIVTDCINSRSLEECINKLESIGRSNKGREVKIVVFKNEKKIFSKLLKYNNKNSIASRVKLKHGGSIGQRVKNRHIEMKRKK
ncbi:unnamed protein product [Rhizophagus irregularis]|nr:unnamed protein product [Rhizophagus irregularis]